MTIIDNLKPTDTNTYALFCDIDGCLHPGGVFKDSNGNAVSEFGDDFQLLQFQYLLESIFRSFPHVKIILSSNWIGCLGYEKTKSYFSQELRDRIIGSTFDESISFSDWNQIPRGQQIINYLEKNKVEKWIALDDRSDGFDDPIFNGRHIKPDEYVGIGNSKIFSQLHHSFNNFLAKTSDKKTFKI